MDDASNDRTIGRTNATSSVPSSTPAQQPAIDSPNSNTNNSNNNNNATIATPPTSGQATNTASSWPTNASHYQLINRVGQGAFASVWRARIVRDDDGKGGDNNSDSGQQKQQRQCAIKIMDLEHVNINISGEKIQNKKEGGGRLF
eukprot:scaffold35594_cov60-Cyclotella_meneghiniana.AAC.1